MIANLIREAMREKNSVKLAAFRAVNSAIQTLETSKGRSGKPASPEEIQAIIRKQIEQRKEAAAAFSNAGRLDLAEKEKSESIYLWELLPPQLDEEQIRSSIQDIIKNIGATSRKDIGRVTKEFNELFASEQGAYDPKFVSRISAELLA